jgi:single-strand DNA-binding protein
MATDYTKQPKETITMMIKLVRIGKDAELRSANGKPVLSLSVVYDVGYGTNKKSQWLNLAMWGAQAEKVVQHFTKGKQIVARVDDVHIEEYNGKSGLKGTLVSFEFVQDGKREQAQEQSARQPTQRQAPVSNDLEDLDLPF